MSKEEAMKIKDVSDIIQNKEDPTGDNRRTDLFRSKNLIAWLLYFPPGDVQRMHNHPADRTYYVITGRGIMKGPNETHELSPGMMLSIPALEFYEGSNPYDEPMVLLGNSSNPTKEDYVKVGGMRSEIDDQTGKRIAFQDGGGTGPSKVVD